MMSNLGTLGAIDAECLRQRYLQDGRMMPALRSMSETEVFAGWKDDASLIREAKAKANLNVSEPIADREISTTDYTTNTSEGTASFGMRTINWLVGRQK